MIKLIIGIVIAAILVFGGYMIVDPIIDKSNSGQVTEVDETYSFTIEGEVLKPGTYVLKEGITMSQLIEAAGGITSNADELAYFPTAKIEYGATYYIAPKYDVADICNMNELKKVNVNSADELALVSVNGITNSIASSIVSYRNENGTFAYLEQLLDVYGIGNATYRKIRGYITLHE